MRGFSFRALCILLPLPHCFPFFALSLPCRLVVVVDDDLLGIVNMHFLLLPLAKNSMIDLDKVINAGSLQMSSWKLHQHRNCKSEPQRNHYRLHLIYPRYDLYRHITATSTACYGSRSHYLVFQEYQCRIITDDLV
jgi:hypothetical protein